jgi:DNA-binding MarR family transcriptional regulator
VLGTGSGCPSARCSASSRALIGSGRVREGCQGHPFVLCGGTRTARRALLTYLAKLIPVPDPLTYDLHKLTARLDRAADRILQERLGLSYSRFLTLFAVKNGAENQRALATWLGQSEPSTSRMVGVLASEGLLDARRVPGAGNARHLRLTSAGAELVERGGRELEGRFDALLERSGVSRERYQRQTRRLLDQLDADAHGSSGVSGAR